ncbi:ABC transporter permease [Tetragenococcus halophilus]|uniref:ABC transporter permease n=1 Tax=Tetragenococcus halophilus TaxID=51669 RepID=UPI001F312CCF|nr:tetronasin resistance protein [Tetragenococcus halophilus]MDN6641306.1 tetronasin resistance protein [Tetragenococcus sp.]MDN6836525.1 tetronasin resistance protein [Lactococcus lactis]MCF1674801.1 tetronasin resistance protein [Tetragenococcus halophilus]MCO8291337.1 tetronasin resistance protein [Tetragenococcus halophilus]MCO8293406.1 tetronasin resistance protein [Tetragenococcus halophilus]
MKEKFNATFILLLQYFKRDWQKIILWILGVGLFSAAFVPAFEEIAKGQGLQGMYETLQNPAMVSMVGPTSVDSAQDYTLGAMYVNEMLLFCALFSMIITILHVINHTRKEEDLGLTELVRSFQVGRQANSLATIIEIVLINGLLMLFISGVMLSFNVDSISLEGIFIFGASIAMAGILGGAVALIMAQLLPNSSGTIGASLGIMGLLYIIRAGTDVSNANLSLFNPLSWSYLTYPFTENNWSFIIYSALFSFVAVFIAFILEGKRDMDRGYLPEKEGRAHAKKSLLSVHGLFSKINKGMIISWLIAFVVMGVAYGSIYGDMNSFIESNELIQQMFTASNTTLEESFTSTIMLVMIFLVAILPISIVNKLFTVEKQQYLSQLFSTKISRAQFYWTTVSLAVFSSLIGILLAAAGLGSTAIISMNNSSTMDLVDFLAAGFNFFPATLFYTGLSCLLLGWVPKWGKVVYIYLGYSFVLSYFGNIVDLPDWFFNTSVENWLAHLPTDDFDLSVFLIISFLSLLLIFSGFLGYKRRDLVVGT